jgi:hypothetical protein
VEGGKIREGKDEFRKIDGNRVERFPGGKNFTKKQTKMGSCVLRCTVGKAGASNCNL